MKKGAALLFGNLGKAGFQSVGFPVVKAWVESADKPGSVVGSHSSGTMVTHRLKQPTRRLRRAADVKDTRSLTRLPIWLCSEWGLPCRPCCHVRGELLPRHFNLT